jgi:hypothetical protein
LIGYIDILNDSLLSQWLAIPPQGAAQLAVTAADSIDRELEEASPEFITEVEGLGEKYRLYRSKAGFGRLFGIEKAVLSRF